MQCFTACAAHALSVPSFVGGPLWATGNNAAADSRVQTPLRDPAFRVFSCTSGSGPAGLYGNPVFNVLRACHTIFHRSYTILRPLNSAQLGRRAALSNSHRRHFMAQQWPSVHAVTSWPEFSRPGPCSKGLLVSQDSAQTALNWGLTGLPYSLSHTHDSSACSLICVKGIHWGFTQCQALFQVFRTHRWTTWTKTPAFGEKDHILTGELRQPTVNITSPLSGVLGGGKF